MRSAKLSGNKKMRLQVGDKVLPGLLSGDVKSEDTLLHFLTCSGIQNCSRGLQNENLDLKLLSKQTPQSWANLQQMLENSLRLFKSLGLQHLLESEKILPFCALFEFCGGSCFPLRTCGKTEQTLGIQIWRRVCDSAGPTCGVYIDPPNTEKTRWANPHPTSPKAFWKAIFAFKIQTRRCSCWNWWKLRLRSKLCCFHEVLGSENNLPKYGFTGNVGGNSKHVLSGKSVPITMIIPIWETGCSLSSAKPSCTPKAMVFQHWRMWFAQCFVLLSFLQSFLFVFAPSIKWSLVIANSIPRVLCKKALLYFTLGSTEAYNLVVKHRTRNFGFVLWFEVSTISLQSFHPRKPATQTSVSYFVLLWVHSLTLQWSCKIYFPGLNICECPKKYMDCFACCGETKYFIVHKGSKWASRGNAGTGDKFRLLCFRRTPSHVSKLFLRCWKSAQ